MRKLTNIFVAALCCAIAFPVIGFKTERKRSWLPKSLTMEQQAKIDNEDGPWFHRRKNEWVDRVRADSEWYGKFMAHVCAWLVAFCLIALAY